MVNQLTSISESSPVQGQSKKRKWAWWSLFSVIVLSGFLLTFVGFRHGLPYIDFPDEMTIWTMGRATFDPSWTMFQPQYPPGILAVSSVVQQAEIAGGNPYVDPATTVEVMRFTSVCAFTLTLALTMLIAYRINGALTGVIAGLCWLAVPLANYQAKVATIDAWVCMWFIASIAAGVEGYYRRSKVWIALSLVLAIIATLFKWQAAAALGMPILSCFTFWTTNRRLMIKQLAFYLIIVGLFSYWVIFVHKALEGGVYLPGTTTSFPTVIALLSNLRIQLFEIGPAFIFGLLPIVGLALSLVIPQARKQLHSRMALWTFPLIIFAFDVVISFAGAKVFPRHYLAALTLLGILFGIGISLLRQVGRKLVTQYQLPAIAGVLPAALALLLFAIQWLPAIKSSLDLDADMVRVDRRTIFAAWADKTAIDGPMLITDPSTNAAIQTLYGYSGRSLETSVYAKETEVNSALIAAKNIRYVITQPYVDTTNFGVPLTKLISYNSNPQYRGSEWTAYYVGHLPLLPFDKVAAFGNTILLRGFALSKETACAGDSLTMRLLWSARTSPSRYYSFFLHLNSDKTGEISAPINGQQPVSDSRPTISWTNPGELLVGPEFSFTLAKDLPAGNYELWLGLFDPISGDYLRLPEGKHYDVITTVKVVDCTF